MRIRYCLIQLRRGGSTLACTVLLAACASSSPKKIADQPPQPESPPVIHSSATVADASLISTTATAGRQAVLLPGSGQFNNQPAETSEHTSQGAGTIQLGFVDTEIHSVLGSVLGDALGINFTVDPAIKGNLTLQSSRLLTKDEVLPSLEQALSLQDVAMVQRDGGYDIVPMKNAPHHINSITSANGQLMAGFAVEIVPLRYTSAAEMEKVLAPFASPGAIMRTDDARNLLVLAGTSGELKTLTGIVKTFDVDWLSGMSFAMFPVQYVDAKTLTDQLKELLIDSKSPLNGVIRLIPVPQLNTVIVASPQQDYLQQIGTWIQRLDLGTSSPGRRVYVYDVQNGKASDLATSLNTMFGLGSAGTEAPTAAANSSSAQTAGGSLSGLTSTQGSGFSQAAPSQFAVPSFATATNGSQRSGVNSAAPGGSSVSLENAGLRIVPSGESNALLILATPSEFATLESAIKRLDTAPRQVMIEASLAEVSLTQQLKFGVQWKFNSSTGAVGFSADSSGGTSQQFPGFSYIYTGSSSIQAVLNTLESITRVNVISAPKLMVLNNHQAQIQVGDQVPILTQQAVSTTQSNAAIVNSVQQRDTGVILQVTPRVNKSGMVILDIAQEVSQVIPTTTSTINSPTIQERKISSTVAVHDGDTVALGGLISTSKTKGRVGIPLLQRIPLIGYLFGTTDSSNDRTELIVLIKPHVVQNDDEMRSVMESLQREFSASDLQGLIHEKSDASKFH